MYCTKKKKFKIKKKTSSCAFRWKIKVFSINCQLKMIVGCLRIGSTIAWQRLQRKQFLPQRNPFPVQKLFHSKLFSDFQILVPIAGCLMPIHIPRIRVIPSIRIAIWSSGKHVIKTIEFDRINKISVYPVSANCVHNLVIRSIVTLSGSLGPYAGANMFITNK